MSDEGGKEPKVGETVLWIEEGGDDGDWQESVIQEVEEFDDSTGLFAVQTDDGPFTIYWDEGDKSWIHQEE